ncbi:MAG: hypothetical protein ACRETA_11805 [Gammaproteobacteria bacterium]
MHKEKEANVKSHCNHGCDNGGTHRTPLALFQRILLRRAHDR